LILGIGGLVLLLCVYYTVVIEGLQQSIAQQQQSLSNEAALAAWMLNVSPELQRLRRANNSNPSANTGGSLLSVVDQTSKAAGLGKSITRLQPEGDAEVRAWLDAAPFNETLRWLRTLESDYGVDISELSFNRDDKDGRVKARVTFKRTT
ncbi:MAG: type II secretion system protein GspM, partial [Nevskiales bacterium]